MTREEAITYLEDAKIKFKIPKAAVTARKTNEALDMAIEALEQEPTLDKIREEIMSLTNGDTPERIWNVDVLEIIDKYKAESEDKE
jgi:hypothetical protein